MSQKYIIAIIVIVILIAGGMYGYSKYSQNQAKESVENYLQDAGSSKPEEQSMQANENQVGEQQAGAAKPFNGSVALSPENTKLAWIGRKTLVVGYEDAGSIAIQSGSAEVKDGKVVSARAVIDMSSINTLKSGKGKDEDMLTRHLKSEDFFDVEKYPTSELNITRANLVSENGLAQNYEFSGMLTMKGISAEVSFPGTVVFEAGKVTLQSETKLDRTKWGVNYGSSKLANAFIDDLFTLKIYIEAVIVK